MAAFLCITNGTMATGETFVMTRFAKELERAGHDVRFLSPSFGSTHLERAGFPCQVFTDSRRDNRRMLEETIRSSKPDVILLADYYFFVANSYLRKHIDLGPVLDSGAALGIFDNAGFYTTNARGMFRNTMTRLMGSLTIPRLPSQTSFLLKPCPPHDPSIEETNVYRFYLGSEPHGSSKQEARARIRERVGCPADAKLILWPVAGYLYELRWAPRLDRSSFNDRGLNSNRTAEWAADRSRPEKNWYYHVNELVVAYLAKLGVRVHLVNMSPYADKYAAPEREGVTCCNVDGVGFGEFDEFLRGVDAYFIDNRFSTTLGRALDFDTQVACLISTLQIRRLKDRVEPSFALSPLAHQVVKELQSKHPRSIKPTYFSHLGWVDQLAKLVTGNVFCDTYRLIDLFDEPAALHVLEQLLVDEESQRSLIDGKERYLARSRQLPSVATIAESVLERRVGGAAQ